MQAEKNNRYICRNGGTTEAIAAILLFAVALAFASCGAEYIKKSLSLSITAVIPVLFPSAVISGIIASGHGGKLLISIFGRAIKSLFGVGKNATPAVILGFFCGFPIGAMVASRLYAQGSITKSELTRLMTFVNNPGAAFVIYSLGGEMLGSMRLGVIIYVSILLTAAISGILGRFFMDTELSDGVSRSFSVSPLPDLVTSSVSSAISGMLSVCAYSAFFSAVVGILSRFLTHIGISFSISAAIFGFFELISGVGFLAQSSNGLFAALSAAAVCSWSGISVMMQISAVCRSSLGDEKFSFAPMMLSKCFQSILCPCLVFLLIKLTRIDI